MAEYNNAADLESEQSTPYFVNLKAVKMNGANIT